MSPAQPQPKYRRDAGFTLLEVMVLVLVVGILLAIGIPTYLGARDRAADRVAQASARNAAAAALVFFTDDASFRRAGVGNLPDVEPGLDFVSRNTRSTSPETVSVWWQSGAVDRWGSAVMSDSGTCFFIVVDAAAPTRYGSSDSAPCRGNSALANATDASW